MAVAPLPSRDAERRVLAAYHAALARIRRDAQELADAHRRAIARGEDISPAWLFRQRRYAILEHTILREMRRLEAAVVIETRRGQSNVIPIGAKDALRSVTDYAPTREARVRVEQQWGRFDPSDVEQLVGNTANGRPLASLVQGMAPGARDAVAHALVVGIVAGQSPRRTARAVQDALGTTSARALTITRTETLRAYREARISSMRQSRIVDAWTWVSVLGPRTCPMCYAMHGTVHPMSEQFGSHPNCFPAGTLVDGPPALAATTRWYDGELVDLRLASGRLLACTPNHPVLTPEGWVAAGLVKEGGYVVGRAHGQRPLSHVDPDHHDVPASIEQVAVSLGGSRAVTSVAMPTAAEDFHGDGLGSDVHVVRADGLLRRGLDAALLQPAGEQRLCRRHAELALFSGGGALDLLGERMLAAADGIVGRSDVGAALRGRAGGLLQAVGVGDRTSLDSLLGEDPLDDTTPGPEGLGESLLRFAGQVAPDQIVRVRVRSFRGHVYNLQTSAGWYIANGIVTHNCRCAPVARTISWAELGIDAPETTPYIEPGPRIFARLPAAEKTRILGPGGHDLYRRGVPLERFAARTYTQYGLGLRRVPNRDLQHAALHPIFKAP